MKKLTQKDVRLGIKKGMTLEEFLKKYDASEEEFKKALEKLYKYNDEGEKLFKQISDTKEKKSKKEPKEQLTVDAPEPDALETLIAREKELSKVIMGLENDHVELAKKHKANLVGFREMAAVLAEAEAGIRKAFECYEKIAEADGLVVEEMNAISDSRRTKLTEIEQVRSRIKELTTIHIFVYKNGEMECDETLNDSGFEEIYNQMLKNEVFEDFRIKDVKILAKVQAMANNSDKQVEVVFENEVLQDTWREVIPHEENSAA